MTWRYRQFVQGVLFDDHDKESTVESSDEEFVPPAMEEPERSYKRRLSAKEVNDVRFVIVLFRCHVGPQRSASAGAHSLARVCTVADAQPDAAAADADVDATSGTEDAVHVLRAAAAAAVSPLFARRLPPQLSRSPASAPADTADTASRAIARAIARRRSAAAAACRASSLRRPRCCRATPARRRLCRGFAGV